MERKEFIEKIGKEPMYFHDPHEGCVVRTEPVNDDIIKWVKFKGRPEFLAKHGSTVTFEAVQIQNIITKKEFDNFG
ncbi:MAG: hypothetical protein Q8T08_17575 [Ignavibacteria bacterium]|nr:hypothetical protein [Ignavibacteria bacterium]